MTSDCRLFACTQCGDCCKGFGGTYLSDSDMDAIAEFIGVSETEFIASYCVPSGRGYVLIQGADGYCIFHEGNCTIHAVKPRMCRQWPFIPSLLVDINNWRMMAGVCPGMRDDLDDDQLLSGVEKKLGE